MADVKFMAINYFCERAIAIDISSFTNEAAGIRLYGASLRGDN